MGTGKNADLLRIVRNLLNKDSHKINRHSFLKNENIEKFNGCLKNISFKRMINLDIGFSGK